MPLGSVTGTSQCACPVPGTMLGPQRGNTGDDDETCVGGIQSLWEFSDNDSDGKKNCPWQLPSQISNGQDPALASEALYPTCASVDCCSFPMHREGWRVRGLQPSTAEHLPSPLTGFEEAAGQAQINPIKE